MTSRTRCERRRDSRARVEGHNFGNFQLETRTIENRLRASHSEDAG